MISKNKKEILENSNKLSNKFLKYIERYTRKFIDDKDATEHVYFSIYCAAMVSAKISLGIDRFCKLYGFDKIDSKEVINMINEVSNEIIKENDEKIH